MATVKTAISLQEYLFEQAEAIAAEMKISRSRLIAIALEEFIRRHQNRILLEKINAAYGDISDTETLASRSTILENHKSIIEDEC
ncbi:hypothetical protein Tery_0629 [Trichodesmium erythraeum IMS101]|uniref:Transcriptional regulator, CopG family n=1 Tax=Trichodesmium erythraeum (strain IMS101) TaxID=203124 RepID=Q118K3_TRIEI|nr:hypothetical protein [Trichodesmium erythraeum GBRTRLIN201]MCH2049618.1 hypothetical protein [Trichodesmium sp. ALOHA_ZT_67]MDE5093405.1 hypothetical protein [Trichodesmium sp. St11_bin5]MDT9339128.1 hypothetical protein [Trichodesmium erythraeum 21-75]